MRAGNRVVVQNGAGQTEYEYDQDPYRGRVRTSTRQVQNPVPA